MGEVALGKRQAGHPAHEGESSCIFRLCIVRWENVSIPAIKLRMRQQIVVVQKYTAIPRIGWTRWGTSGVRVENIPRTRLTADPPRNPKVVGRIELYTRKFPCNNYIYVDVQRHHLEK